MLGDILSDDSAWGSIVQTGNVKGKVLSPVTPSQTRGMVLQLVTLQLCNYLILNRILPKLDAYARDLDVEGVVLGCGKGGDTMDICFSMTQVLEKARDRMNAGAVAIADVRKCHDEVHWGQALAGALRRGFEHDDAVALLRLHRLP